MEISRCLLSRSFVEEEIKWDLPYWFIEINPNENISFQVNSKNPLNIGIESVIINLFSKQTIGSRNGACYMIDGDPDAWEVVQPIFKDTAVENGLLFAGKAGSGHYLKMVLNGIEYATMNAIRAKDLKYWRKTNLILSTEGS